MTRSRAAVGEFNSSDELQPGRATSASRNSPAFFALRIASPGGEGPGWLSDSPPFAPKGYGRLEGVPADFGSGGGTQSGQAQRASVPRSGSGSSELAFRSPGSRAFASVRR